MRRSDHSFVLCLNANFLCCAILYKLRLHILELLIIERFNLLKMLNGKLNDISIIHSLTLVEKGGNPEICSLG